MSTRATSTTGTTKTRTTRTRTAKPTAHAAVTDEAIAIRAYEIHVSGLGGDEVDNWLRAERELAAER